MKASELRKLIDKEIEWTEPSYDGRGDFIGYGIVKEVTGRNVLVDQCGTLDWLWLPRMFNIRERIKIA
jgi:hypothetical protein